MCSILHLILFPINSFLLPNKSQNFLFHLQTNLNTCLSLILLILNALNLFLYNKTWLNSMHFFFTQQTYSTFVSVFNALLISLQLLIAQHLILFTRSQNFAQHNLISKTKFYLMNLLLTPINHLFFHLLKLFDAFCVWLDCMLSLLSTYFTFIVLYTSRSLTLQCK